MKFQSVQSDLNHFTVQLRWHSIGGEQGHLSHGPVAILDHLDCFDPGGALGVVDFAKVENLPLDHFGVHRPVILNDTPIAVLFAVFEPCFVSEEHSGQCTGGNRQIKRVGRHYKQNQRTDFVISTG
jgi:hypothetical protein